MFSKDSKTSSETAGSKGAAPSSAAKGVPSIISVDLKIVGDLKSSGDIQVDGTIEGDIDSRTLIVGEGAKVEGSITAETVRISGTIVGQVKSQSVTLARSARVTGDITHGSLVMEAGAFLEGSVRRLEAGQSAAGGKVAPLRPQTGGNGQESGYREGKGQAV